MDYLKLLNPQQHKAVTAPPGPVLVLAGPGSGKTRVLTQRIAYLIQAQGVRPSNILAVTFTNKAAREMADRVEKLLPGQGLGVWLGTFHGICARILRREATKVGLENSFVIFDTDDQMALVKAAIKELHFDEKRFRPNAALAVISHQKQQNISPAEYTVAGRNRDEMEMAKGYKAIYEQYEERLRLNNAVDFDDLLNLTYNLLKDQPTVRQQYAQRFEHVLVDEFQDTNMIQYELLKLFSAYHHNLFVVGDEDQSIYRWRGADYHNVLRFEQENPGALKVLLEQNYRSRQNVLDAARAVIDKNSNRTQKFLFSERGAGDPLVYYEAPDDEQEARYVVDTIRELVGGKHAQPGDFAIMYRTNAQSRMLEESFLRAGLPYRLVGAQRFYGRREVKDVLAYLRLVHNPDDAVSLSRIINTPPRKLGAKTVEILFDVARYNSTTPGEVLLDLGTKMERSAYLKQVSSTPAALVNFGAMVAGWRKLAEDEAPLPDLFDRILADTRFQEYLDEEDRKDAEVRRQPSNGEKVNTRWDNVVELRRLVFQYKDRKLGEFLENVALVSDQDTLVEDANAPTLLTLHAAKGLEFRRVFIVGLDEGILPHIRSMSDEEEMAEERRLFYVGLTRAMDNLYLVRAAHRAGFGETLPQMPSRFLKQIPDELVEDRTPRRKRSAWDDDDEDRLSYEDFRQQTRWGSGRSESSRRSQGGYRSSRSRDPYEASSYSVPEPERETKTYRPAQPAERKFQPGMRVRHPAWGEGMVLASSMESDGEEMVTIFFEDKSVGQKRVMASFVKMDIL